MSQDFLDQIERQLMAATERGARRRRFWQLRLRLRVPTFAVAAIAVTAVTATALAAELGLPTVTHTAPAAPAHSAPRVPGTEVADGLDPESFTAIGEFTWWLLGTTTCGDRTCAGIARTQDGGRSFTWIPAPTTDPQAIGQLRFANAQDGYAFGPELWSTHDGGASWHQVQVGGTVISLAASGPYVYAQVAAARGPGRVMRSPVGNDAWTTLITTGEGYSGLWVGGADVLVDSTRGSGAGGNQLLISHDHGATFTSYKAPPAVVCNFDEGSPNVIWEPCVT
ncbi:MAG: WD40/YVTN/BNR-like repeat-containing protein, partial [Solirubrobacteraceae bacterium]